MIVDAISDLHGHYPKLDGGDLLIVAGDMTADDTARSWAAFLQWIIAQSHNYGDVVIIAGNHDNYIHENPDFLNNYDTKCYITYLCDAACHFQKDGDRVWKIWGSPWTLSFKGMNPKCKAFTCTTEAVLEKKFEKIPADTDILITHSPPWGYFDECVQGNQIKSVGSRSLRAQVMCIAPKLHVFGHIHENGGQVKQSVVTKFVNASHVDEWYRPINKPVRVIL